MALDPGPSSSTGNSQSETRIWIGRLPADVSEHTFPSLTRCLPLFFFRYRLLRLCSSYGHVSSFDLILNKEGSKPFAFVGYATNDEAKEAIESINKRGFDGHKILANWIRPKLEASNTDKKKQLHLSSKTSSLLALGTRQSGQQQRKRTNEEKMKAIEAALKRTEEDGESSVPFRFLSQLRQTSSNEESKTVTPTPPPNPLEKFLNVKKKKTE